MSLFMHFFIGTSRAELPMLLRLTNPFDKENPPGEFNCRLAGAKCENGVFTNGVDKQLFTCTEETVALPNGQSLRVWTLEGEETVYLNLTQYIQLVKTDFVEHIRLMFNKEFGDYGYFIAQVGWRWYVVERLICGDAQLLERAAKQKGVEAISARMNAPVDKWETISRLVGKTLAGVVFLDGEKVTEEPYSSDEMVLLTTDGDVVSFGHERSCCEQVYVSDVEGDLADIIGSPITRAETVSRVTSDQTSSWTYYRFETAKGGIVVRWQGESNGYYSIEVEMTVSALPQPFANGYSHEVLLHLNRLVFGAENEYEVRIKASEEKRRVEMEAILQRRVNKAKLTFQVGATQSPVGDYIVGHDIALRIMEELCCVSNPTQTLEWFIQLFRALRLSENPDTGLVVLENTVKQFSTRELAEFKVRKDI